MAEMTNLVAFGVLMSIGILALKTGLGCGFASLRQREVISFASLYLIASIAMGYLIGIIPLDLTQNVLATGVTMHVIIAIGLIYFGVRTKKEWQSCGCDLSRKTFLWLSLPCPACLTALFLACTVLAAAIDYSNIVVGAMVGGIFFTGICLSAFSISFVANIRGCKDPSALGTAMILFGLLYLLSPLIIPAYMQAQTVSIPSSTVDLDEVILSFSLMTGLGTIGFMKDRYCRLKD